MTISYLIAALTFAWNPVPAPQEATPLRADSVVCAPGSVTPFAHGSTLVALPDGRLLCAWYGGSNERTPDVTLYLSERAADAEAWTTPRIVVDTPDRPEANPVLFVDPDGPLWIFYQTMYGDGDDPTKPGTGWATCKVKARTSTDGGATWSDERVLIEEQGYLTRNKLIVLEDGSWVLPMHDERDWTSRMYLSTDKGATWAFSDRVDSGLGFKKGNIVPTVIARKEGSLLCLMRSGSQNYRTWQSVSGDHGHSWTSPQEINVPNPNAALDIVRLDSGNMVMALNPVPDGGRQRLDLWLSYDDGKSWPIRRTLVDDEDNYASYPALITTADGNLHVSFSRKGGSIAHATVNESWIWQDTLLGAEPQLANVVPPVIDGDDPRSAMQRNPGSLPIADAPFEEHVQRLVSDPSAGRARHVRFGEDGAAAVLTNSSEGWQSDDFTNWTPMAVDAARTLAAPFAGFAADGGLLATLPGAATCSARQGKSLWIGTDSGLYRAETEGDRVSALARHDHYGTNGPLATEITALATDSRGTLWIGTPLGLTTLSMEGVWAHIRGREGLPVEAVTAIAITKSDHLWIGTQFGLAYYKPYEEGRQWFYRANGRYLPGNYVFDVAVSDDARHIVTATDAGIGCIEVVQTTMQARAEVIEQRVNKYHRRLGLVATCAFPDPWDFSKCSIKDSDNDGLWSAYHVAALSLAYGATGDPAAKASAGETMHAVIMLQNASGTPGLVARSVLPVKDARDKDEQWRLTPDGKMKWKSDTSSDEIDGHYLAFYTYWEHIAQFDPEERALIIKQVRDVTDYLLQGNYQLLDWDGKRTRWGFWNPENLNDDPTHYLESGLNGMQMLSFLKTAYYITGDVTYQEHYRKLAIDHHYLSNLLLAKKVFPDMNNHSDDQLGFVGWYPLLQTEHDPVARQAILTGVRRHYKIIEPERASFFIFAYASMDPDYANIELGVENLRTIPTDRRDWLMMNSHRSDVIFDPRPTRFGDPQLINVLHADERAFAKWNRELMRPDDGRGGAQEDDGAAYLLPYWMGRYHGFITAAE